MPRFRFLILAVSVFYVLAFGRAIGFFIDEAYTYNLATDASLVRMLSALKEGADGSFPLHPVLVFFWTRLFGGSELSLRLASGLFILMLVWHGTGQLGRRFHPWAAALAVLFVLANRNFAYYASQARCYGLAMFLFSLVFWGTWRMVQGQPLPSSWACLGHGIVCGLLCLSHPLGILYVGILALLYAGFALSRRTFSVAGAASFLGGPLLLLTWIPCFLVQRKVNPAVPPAASLPSFTELWQFAFLNSWILFATLLAGAALWLARCWTARKEEESRAAPCSTLASAPALLVPSRRTLVLYSILFIVLMNGALVLLDAANLVPAYRFQAIRYVLVCVVPFAVILAAVFGLFVEMCASTGRPRWIRFAGPALPAGLALGLLAGMASYGWSQYSARSIMEGFLVKVSQVARERQLEIVCANHVDAFFLVTRAHYPEVKYILPDDFPFLRLMRQMELYYPSPAILSPKAAEQLARDYLFLPVKGEAVVVSPSKNQAAP